MKLTFNNVNPCKLQDSLIQDGIIPILVQNDCKDGESIASNVYITLDDSVDTSKVTEIVNNVVLTQSTNTATTTEPTNSDLQTQIYNLTSLLVSGGII